MGLNEANELDMEVGKSEWGQPPFCVPLYDPRLPFVMSSLHRRGGLVLGVLEDISLFCRKGNTKE